MADSIYSLVITGLTTKEQCAITLWSDKDDFTPGKSYTIDALNGTTNNILVYASPFGSSDPASDWTSTYDFGVQPQQFQCTITEVTSAYIKGTFSGTIYQNSSTVTTKVVASGQFYAKF